MTTFNTGNPIGSTDARDRLDNSENLDFAVNSLSQTFVDRLGVARDTLEGIYQKSAYYRAGTFDAGYTLTNNRQTLEYNGLEYSWSGAFPKAVPAGSTPATSGGIGAGAWVDRTDVTLRGEISGVDGAGLIGSMSYAQLRAYSGSQNTVNVWGISNAFDGANGQFKVNASDTTSADNGGTILVDASGRRWYRVYSGAIDFAWYGAKGDGVTDDYAAIKQALSSQKSTGVTFSVNKFYAISKGILLPPRCTLEGIGRDSCGFIKTTHTAETVATRQWQTHTDNYSYDFIVALDIDNDPSGDLTGNHIRGHQIKNLSLSYSTSDKGGYGVYSFYAYEVLLDNLQISNVTYGVTSKSWLWRLNSVMVYNAITGFQVKEGTSHTFINCYAKNVSVGYEITNLTYSNFISCACDYVSSIAYRLQGCYSTTFTGCGCEDTVQKILYIVGGNRLSFVGFRALNVTYTPGYSPLYLQDSYVTFDSVHINYTLTTATPFIGMNNSTLNLINSSVPTGAGSYNKWDIGTLSYVNIMNEQGFMTLIGQAGVMYYGQICNGQYTIYNEYSAPVGAVSFLPTGTRWRKRVPTSGNPYEWIFNGANWIVTATMP